MEVALFLEGVPRTGLGWGCGSATCHLSCGSRSWGARSGRSRRNPQAAGVHTCVLEEVVTPSSPYIVRSSETRLLKWFGLLWRELDEGSGRVHSCHRPPRGRLPAVSPGRGVRLLRCAVTRGVCRPAAPHPLCTRSAAALPGRQARGTAQHVPGVARTVVSPVASSLLPTATDHGTCRASADGQAWAGSHSGLWVPHTL